MKILLLNTALLALISSCKKDGALNGNLNDRPAEFLFTITDSKSQSLFTSTSNQITASYQNNGKITVLSDQYYPFKTTGGTTDYICGDFYMAQKSIEGTKTFYLTFQSKTDTLGLDIHRVPATPDNGGNSTPIVTFNGRPMQSVSGGTSTPDYFVLKRR